jgi:ABC-type glycerol-3-phosphate transport system substrate-binding protein
MGLGSTEVINYAIRAAVYAVDGQSPDLTAEENEVFVTNIYEKNGVKVRLSDEEAAKQNLEAQGYRLVSSSFANTYIDARKTAQNGGVPVYNFSPAAMNTLTLLNTTYGVPMTMSFAMMFYRMDALAQLNKSVPETWDELLALLPDLQTNNMTIGVSYVSALDFMIYQQGSNMWRYTNDLDPDTPLVYNPYCEGSKINLDSDIALKAFDFVCSLYSDYSLPVSYDASNRFRTGEMPIIIGDYIGTYNTLVIYASEIGGLWEFSSLPGSEYVDENGVNRFNYDSLAGVTACVIPNGADNIEAAWAFMQWQTGAEAQATYGNRIVALIGPAAKYETANIFAIEDLSWTAAEKAAIRDQMANLNSIVNYPGSYIIARYMKFAFLDTQNKGIPAHEAMMSYISAINTEVERKRKEFFLPVVDSEDAAKDMSLGLTNKK